MQLNFLKALGQRQYWSELFIASIVLTLLLVLAEAQSWAKITFIEVLSYFLYINWIMLAFIALIDALKNKLQRLRAIHAVLLSFILLQTIILTTTLVLNLTIHWGRNFSLQNFSVDTLLQQLVLHGSYGVLLGAFCLRYIYVREEWLKKQNSELNAKIQALQARIHPHFLFNSLNSVVSLIGSDPERAEQMLIDLSRLFRASFKEMKLVTLKEEIQLCQHYLSIEKIRLGDRLEVEWNIPQPERLHEANIPILTLQPLLENSIFHGVERKMLQAKICILVEILENQVTIVITNPFLADKMTDRESNGIALDNVKQRLKAHYGYQVQFRNHTGNGIFTTFVQYQYK